MQVLFYCAFSASTKLLDKQDWSPSVRSDVMKWTDHLCLERKSSGGSVEYLLRLALGNQRLVDLCKFQDSQDYIETLSQEVKKNFTLLSECVS